MDFPTSDRPTDRDLGKGDLWRTQIKKPLSGPGSDREIIRILSKQLYLGTDDRLHFASFRASDSSFEGTVVTGLVDLVE